MDAYVFEIENDDLKIHCVLDNESNTLLKSAMDILGLSARAYDRILKVSQTTADLEEVKKITSAHISETIQYRRLDQQMWLD